MNIKHSIIWYWLFGLLGNGLGFLISIIINAHLSLSYLGVYGQLTTIVLLFSVISVSIGISANRFQAEIGKNLLDRSVLWLRHFGSLMGIVSGLLALVYLWMTRSGINLVLLDYVVLMFTVYLMYPIAWLRHMLLSQSRYLFVGMSVLLEAVVKLMLLQLLLNVFPLHALFISFGLSSLVVWWGLSNFYHKTMGSNQIVGDLDKRVVRFLGRTIWLRIGTIFGSGLDVLLASFWLGRDDLGLYTLLSIIGKIVYFMGQSIYLLVTPYVAPVIGNIRERRRRFLVLMSMNVTIMILSSILLIISEAVLSTHVFGERYIEIEPYLPWYLGATVLLSVLMFVCLYYTLQEQYSATWWLYGALLLYIVGAMIQHDSINWMSKWYFLSTLAGIFGVSLWGFYSKRTDVVDRLGEA